MIHLLFSKLAKRRRLRASAGLPFLALLACQTFDLPAQNEPGCTADCAEFPPDPPFEDPPAVLCPGLPGLRVTHDPGSLNASGGQIAKQLFTWLSSEELEEFLEGPPGRAPKGGQNRLSTRMQDQLLGLAVSEGTSFEAKQLAYYLAQNTKKLTTTWPRAFALRQSLGETRRYPVRLQLSDDAWWAAFDGRTLRVFESSGAPINVASALLTPERIQAIYFEDSLQATFSASACDLGLVEPGRDPLARAVLLLETAEIVSAETEGAELLGAVEGEVSVLESFFHSFRASEMVDDLGGESRAQQSCLWSSRTLPASCTEHYSAALATLDSNYALSRDRLAQLIDTLRSDLRTESAEDEAELLEMGAGGGAP